MGISKWQRDQLQTEQDRLIFQTYIDDIRHAKNQQWLTASYIVGLQIALITLVYNFEIKTDLLKYIVYCGCPIVSLILAHFGFFLAKDSKRIINEYRYNINILISRFNKNDEYKPVDRLYLLMFTGVHFLFFLAVAIISLDKSEVLL